MTVFLWLPDFLSSGLSTFHPLQMVVFVKVKFSCESEHSVREVQNDSTVSTEVISTLKWLRFKMQMYLVSSVD